MLFLDRQGHILSSYQLALLHQPQCSWHSRPNLLPPRIWPAVFFLTASLKRYMMFCRARLICSWRSVHCSACRPYHPLSPEKNPRLDAGDRPLQAWVLLRLWEASCCRKPTGRLETAVVMNHSRNKWFATGKFVQMAWYCKGWQRLLSQSNGKPHSTPTSLSPCHLVEVC